MDNSNIVNLDEKQFEQLLSEEAAKFELNLIASSNDAFDRVKKRHAFYAKQEEIRSERIRRIGTIIKKKRERSGSRTSRPISNRTFEAGFTNKQYHGTIISPQIQEEQIYLISQMKAQKEQAKQAQQEKQGPLQGIPKFSYTAPNNENAPNVQIPNPVFLGEDGTLYDINYVPIHVDEQVAKTKRGKFSKLLAAQLGKKESNNNKDQQQQQNQQDQSSAQQSAATPASSSAAAATPADASAYEYCHDPELYQTPPSPHSFQTFEEYEEALVQWASDVQRKLGYLQLPRVMGRHYYRPYVNSATPQANSGSANNADNQDNMLTVDTMDIEETWEANLVPMEPKPEFYETFEEYEKALSRWAVICYSLPFLPPHPAQFQKLLGIRLSRPPAFPVPDVDLSNQQAQRRQDRLDSKIQSKNIAKDIQEKKEHIVVHNYWGKLNPEDQKSVSEAIEKVLEQKLLAKSKLGAFHPKLTPRIHGTFEEDTKLMRGISFDDLQFKGARNEEPQTVKEWVVLQRQDRSLSSVFAHSTLPYYQAIADDCKHQIAQRRSDLIEDELKEAQDCKEWEQGKSVRFKIPDFDIGQLDFNMMIKHPASYIRFLQVVLTRMDHAKRYDHLNSWYFPTLQQQVHADDLKQLNSLMTEKMMQDPLKNMSMHAMQQFFLTNSCLDTFARWLQGNVPGKGFTAQFKNETIQIKFYKQVLFHASTKPEGFQAILSLMNSSKSTLVHGKVSEFILQFFKTKTAEFVIKHVIDQADINSLLHLATCASFYDEVPVIIFSYDAETRSLVKQMLGASVDSLIVNLLTAYYLDCILISLLEEDKYFPNVYPFLVKEVERLIEVISKSLKEDNKFLSSHIWYMLGHRSKKFSHLGYFLLSFLFNLSYTPIIYDLMRAPNTRLVEMIRKLASSKFTHVREAIARLWVILEQRKWQSLLTQTYADALYIVNDVVVSAERTVLDSQPPLISSLVLDFMSSTLEVKDSISTHTQSMIKGLLDSKAFHKTLMEVVKTFHQKRLHQGTIMGAAFLARFAKFLICHQMVITPDSQKNARRTIISLFQKKEVKKKKQQPSSGAQQGVSGNSGASGFGNSSGSGGFGDDQGAEDDDPTLIDANRAMEDITTRLEITYDNLMQLFDLVCNETNLSNKRRAYRPRTYLLECLRHLLKCPDVFDLLQSKKEKADLINMRILEICKDGTDMEFNRNAWRLVYQMIKFHSGVLEQLVKTSKINSFMELIGSGLSSVVITNSLHYFDKIFNLPLDPVFVKQETEKYALLHNIPQKQAEAEYNPYAVENSPMFNKQKRHSDYMKLLYGKQNVDDEEVDEQKRKRLQTKRGFNVPDEAVQKNYERAVRGLIDHISTKQLFIIFHMAYGKLVKNYAGWPFQSLVSFYDTLNNHKSCEKLIMIFKKSKEREYSDGLKMISDMVLGTLE